MKHLLFRDLQNKSTGKKEMIVNETDYKPKNRTYGLQSH